MPNKVILKANRDKPLRHKHPWVFSGALDRIDPDIVDGDVVDVVTPQGEFLARGYLNRHSQIVVRVLTWDEGEAIDEGFWARHLGVAISWRVMGDHEARRLVNAESDGLPGLVVDRYGEWLILQSLTLGCEKFKPIIVLQLHKILRPAGIYERSDVDVRRKEGLPQTSGVLAGEEPPDRVEVEENGYRYLVDVKRGHKTGFYLDQRENRQKAKAYVKDAEVLNLFCYSGGFTVAALSASAKSVLNVDSSADALELAKANLRLNNFVANDADFVEADVFSLREPADSDLVDGSIGEGSPFHQTFGYYAHGVSPETALLPKGWRDRLIPIHNANTGGGTGLCLEVHDLAVSKLVAGREKDLAFVGGLLRHRLACPETIRVRLNATDLSAERQELCLARLGRLAAQAAS